MGATVPWKLLEKADVTPSRVRILGRTVDLQIDFVLDEWEDDCRVAHGRLVAEVYRLHLGEELDCDIPSLVEGGWFRRRRVSDHLHKQGRRYRLPAKGLASLPDDCCLAVGLPAGRGLYIWSLGITDQPDSQFIFVVDESLGVEWLCEDPDGDLGTGD